MSVKITIINGTNRPGNRSQGVSNYLYNYIKRVDGVEVRIIKTDDFDLSVDGNDEEHKIQSYTDIVSNTDAFIIVAPEYNHSFPGSLKSLLDKELKAYKHKAVGLVGVSAGMFGGARVIESLLPVMRELGLTLSSTALHVQRASNVFELDGSVLDKSIEPKVEGFVDELLWTAKSLKWGRENL